MEETLIEQNETGNTLAKISVTKQFDVPLTGRANFDAQGVAWDDSLPLRSGADRVTIIVRDTASSRVGSLKVPF